MVIGRSFILKLILFLCVISGFIIIKYTNTSIFIPSIAINNIDSSLSLTSCKRVSVEELDQWFHSNQWNEIPKIIHQSWKNKTLRKQQALWSETWCKQYIGWRYHLWTDAENEIFVKNKFPWFYPTYQTLFPTILQADSVRYLYMIYYGGLYLDLDYESFRRVDELFVNKHVVFSLMNYRPKNKNIIPNSWMASRPNHPVWRYILNRITASWNRTTAKERNTYWNGKALDLTGPKAIFDGLMLYLHTTLHTKKTLIELFGNKANQTPHAIFDVANITFLGPKLINAYDWYVLKWKPICSAQSPTFDAKKCQEILKPVYAITYWSHTYGRGHQNDPNYLEKIRTQ